MVLNTTASWSPSGSQAGSVSMSLMVTVIRRPVGDGPISARKLASRSTAMGPVAEPHTTGNTDPSATPRPNTASNSDGVGMLPSRYCSSMSSSATTMPSTNCSRTSDSCSSMSPGMAASSADPLS